MGKQSMGTPATALRHRTDNKLYRLQSGQTPIVRPALHSTYAMDSFPNGTNAVVAVISYTGYDMEDAMILNKSAHERGFGYGTVYKSQIVDLADLHGPVKSTAQTPLTFGLGKDVRYEDERREKVDPDGLPLVGGQYSPGDPIAAYLDETSKRTKFVKYKGDEVAYVDSVRLIGASLPYHLARICSGSRLTHCYLQATTRARRSCRRSTSCCGYLARQSLATSSHLVMDRRVSARRNGLLSTCRSARAAFSQTSSSTRTRFRLA